MAAASEGLVLGMEIAMVAFILETGLTPRTAEAFIEKRISEFENTAQQCSTRKLPKGRAYAAARSLDSPAELVIPPPPPPADRRPARPAAGEDQPGHRRPGPHRVRRYPRRVVLAGAPSAT